MLIHSNTNIHSNPAISTHIQPLFFVKISRFSGRSTSAKMPKISLQLRWRQERWKARSSRKGMCPVHLDESIWSIAVVIGLEHSYLGQQWQVFFSPPFFNFSLAMRDGECSVLKCLFLSLAWIKSSCDMSVVYFLGWYSYDVKGLWVYGIKVFG